MFSALNIDLLGLLSSSLLHKSKLWIKIRLNSGSLIRLKSGSKDLSDLYTVHWKLQSTKPLQMHNYYTERTHYLKHVLCWNLTNQCPSLMPYRQLPWTLSFREKPCVWCLFFVFNILCLILIFCAFISTYSRMHKWHHDNNYKILRIQVKGFS